jgi:glutamate N-acetyltransferase/amino-acid N-acetyltransferase
VSGEVSPLAPACFPAIAPVEGVALATAEAGIRYRGRRDVLLMTLQPGTQVAGTFTRSKCASAPVDWCRQILTGGTARAVVVNSGNANAFTGMRGRDAAALTAELAARAVGCAEGEVFLASTGVIGEPLEAEKFRGVMSGLAAAAAPDAWEEAARAIMTTDTFPKGATADVAIAGVSVRIAGIAKGSGMIAPDMATMLSFVATDAPIAAPALQALHARAGAKTFTCITVDGDTSTSDTVLAFATGAAAARGAPLIEDARDPRLRAFAAAFQGVLADLARQIVRDGEGARKFVTVTVTGATSAPSARRIARSIAQSPLVKTAIAGEDANWGRVVMAVGKAGEPAERDRLTISFGGVRVAHEGMRDPDYDEAAVSAYMKNPEIAIAVDLGLGSGRATMWTCDLTHGYIAINGDYRS